MSNVEIMKPHTYLFEITNRCNLSCDYCMQKLRNNKTNIDLDMNKIPEILDDFFEKNPEHDQLNVHFFGGEPTLMKCKIIDTLNVLKEKSYWKKIRPCITTNALIYFPEWFDFMEKYKDDFFLSISYDGEGQRERTKNEKVIKLIEDNIKKYVNLCYEKNFKILKNVAMHSCLTEENIETFFETFKKITFELKMPLFDFVPVFPEYWSEESFSKLWKQFDKIYNFVLERRKKNNRYILNIPHITLCNKYDSSRYNHIAKNDYRTVKKIPAIAIMPDGEVQATRVNRGMTKRRYKYKTIPVALKENCIYNYKDIELQLLKENSTNHEEFARMTKLLFMGASSKQWKFNIWQIFNFNHYLIKKYLRTIKRIKDRFMFDSYLIFKENGLMHFLTGRTKDTKTIFDIFDKNYLIAHIEKSFVIINGRKYNIIYDSLPQGKLGKNENNSIIIDKKQHKNKNILETIHHEIFHLYMKQIGVTTILYKNNIQDIEEMLCEQYVNYVLNYL